MKYLSALLIGEYSSDQLNIYPLMKFCNRPNELVGSGFETYHRRMRKSQKYFLQNIDIVETVADVEEPIDEAVPGTNHTIR